MRNHEVDLVQNAVEHVVQKFVNAPNVFLTEDDLRTHLWGHLIHHFGDEQETEDHDLSIPLHTEVRWYGSNGKLRLRSDIVIVDVSTLKVVDYNEMPSKGYGFNIPSAIVELKLRRPNGESDNQFRNKILNDIQKLKDLRAGVFESGFPKTRLWVVALDKKSKLADVPKSGDGINVIYRFANVRAQIAN